MIDQYQFILRYICIICILHLFRKLENNIERILNCAESTQFYSRIDIYSRIYSINIKWDLKCLYSTIASIFFPNLENVMEDNEEKRKPRIIMYPLKKLNLIIYPKVNN